MLILCNKRGFRGVNPRGVFCVFYHSLGFCMLVPGMGSGSWHVRSALSRMVFWKSACFLSWSGVYRFSVLKEYVLSGVMSPNLTGDGVSRANRIAPAMSLSFETSTPHSNLLRQASSRI